MSRFNTLWAAIMDRGETVSDADFQEFLSFLSMAHLINMEVIIPEEMTNQRDMVMCMFKGQATKIISIYCGGES